MEEHYGGQKGWENTEDVGMMQLSLCFNEKDGWLDGGMEESRWSNRDGRLAVGREGARIGEWREKSCQLSLRHRRMDGWMEPQMPPNIRCTTR